MTDYIKTEKRELIQAGYKAFNGHVFSENDCKNYNRIQKRINKWREGRDGYAPEGLLIESHKQFCLITGATGF